jgi:hypothetical protein
METYNFIQWLIILKRNALNNLIKATELNERIANNMINDNNIEYQKKLDFFK